MSPELWAQITEICNEALTYKGEDRQNFLQQKCGDDADLQKEVRSLIESYESDPDYLEESIAGEFGLESEGASERIIGPYKLVRQLGQGGMGEVFLALRQDTQQHVAIKLIRTTGQNNAELLRRFEREREILAALNHPNIARLLDIGQSEDGQPYLAMEFVDGVTITEYCDSNRLSIKERLALFVQVCEAVQYAHQNLIVHRDIKPGNLLVTSDGTVKLLDFGIAKLLESPNSALTMLETQTGMQLMTPAYASPEQIQGKTITTNSDVYSLGVLLYELLTGLRPFDFQEKLQAEIYRIIAEDAPTKPSTVIGIDPSLAEARKLSGDRLRKTLRGELDNIVLKTLRKEPTRRYSSAQDLGSDVERYLEDLPVLAQPDTVGYRTRKFVNRHRWGVGMAAVLALTLIGFSALTAYQSKVVAQERDRARAEAKKSAQVSDFLQSLFKSADPVAVQRDTLMIRDFLEEGTQIIDNELAGQPELQVVMLNTIGSAFHNLGRLDRSETLFKQAHDVASKDLGKNHPEYRQSISNLASTLNLLSKESRELELRQELVEIDRNEFGEEHQSVLSNLFLIAGGYHLTRQQAKSDSISAIAHELLSRIEVEDSPEMAKALRSAAKMSWGRGENEQALEIYRKTIDMERRLHGDLNPELSFTLHNFAQALIAADSLEAATEMLKESIAIQEHLFPEGYRDIASSYILLTEILLYEDEIPEIAETYTRNAIDMYDKVLGKNETHMLGWGHNVLGQVLQKRGQFGEAEAAYRQAVSTYVNLFGPQFVVTIERRQDLAMLFVQTGRYKEAEAILKPDFEYLLEKRGPDDKYTKPARSRIIRLYEAWGRPEEADSYVNR